MLFSEKNNKKTKNMPTVIPLNAIKNLRLIELFFLYYKGKNKKKQIKVVSLPPNRKIE